MQATDETRGREPDPKNSRCWRRLAIDVDPCPCRIQPSAGSRPAAVLQEQFATRLQVSRTSHTSACVLQHVGLWGMEAGPPNWRCNVLARAALLSQVEILDRSAEWLWKSRVKKTTLFPIISPTYSTGCYIPPSSQTRPAACKGHHVENQEPKIWL